MEMRREAVTNQANRRDDGRAAGPSRSVRVEREVRPHVWQKVAGSNWALAAYMSKYMNGAMTPAKVTKPAEYKTWASFYSGTWQPVEKAIQAKDVKAFNKAYMDVIGACNGCHRRWATASSRSRT